MWTFENPPLAQLAELYEFHPDPAWFTHLRLASVRLGDGGSGSFVSPAGLLLTNHHVARGQLAKLSSSEQDYAADGFLARDRSEEMKCPDLEVHILVHLEDVTQRVLAAAAAAGSQQDALEARQAEIAAIEQESLTASGLHSEVVGLYQGGEYWLYRYEHYNDVRLVFAPEEQAAYFGGDDDNFTYPRHDLDMALLRVYRNDEPLQTPHWLPLHPGGGRDGDLVFVTGHPGSTDRLHTFAQLAYQRDVGYPRSKARIDTLLALAHEYAARGPEQARQISPMIMGMSNVDKARDGEYKGLLDENLWAVKRAQEEDFRTKVAADPQLQDRYGSAWDLIEKAVQIQRDMAGAWEHKRMPSLFLGRLAQTIVRLVEERDKPDAERLEGYHDSELRRRMFMLFSPAPIYPELEEYGMFHSLRRMTAELGEDDEFVKICLDGKSPAERAKELATETTLYDPQARRALVDGGQEAVAASEDPLIELARALDPILREQRLWREQNIESVLAEAGEMLGAARFAVYGKTTYPDATFTLRLSYGRVMGYPMNGTRAPAHTTWYGLFDRAYSFGLQEPFALSDRVLASREKLDLTLPLNFVSTGDIIGGNSGSPVVDVEGRLVGLVFDGNIESLAGRFVYDDAANRCVSVHAAAIDQALRVVYDAAFLAEEMAGK